MSGIEISVEELANTLQNCDDIDNPIIIKRKNKKDVVVISLEEYKKKILEADIIEKLKKSEDDIKAGRVYDARAVLAELSEEYGRKE